MRVSQLLVHNFRSVCQLTCDIGELATLLGPNNHGKSNILAALEFLLSPGMKLTEEDFFSGRSEGDNSLFVEATFVDLTDQEKNTFDKYVRSDGTIRIQRWAQVNESGGIDSGYRGYVEQPTVWWLQDAALERLRNREAIGAVVDEVPALTSLLEEGGRITKERIQEFQSRYIEEHRDSLDFKERLEETPLLGVKNIAGGILPDCYVIPAVRDLSDETKTTGSATFSRLLQRAVSEMTSRDARFAELQEQLGDLVEELNLRPDDLGAEPQSELERLECAIRTELEPWHVDVSIKVTPPDVRKVFEIGTELWINDGHNTIAERKGHGLQRAVIFSLIRAWASTLRSAPSESTLRSRAASESRVVAYAAPELFLHPHAQRTLAKALKTIAETPEHQVLISTHFVDLENYKSIVVVYRPDTATGTKVKQCTRDLFAGDSLEQRKKRFRMASWVNPDRGELFFAQKVVLVEGETEKAALPFLANKLDCYDPGVSVIDCGCKHNLTLYIEILNAFGIGYAVLHDEDPVPDPPPADWSSDKLREKQRTYALNDEIRSLVVPNLGYIRVISPDFERFCGIPLSQGEKKGKPLAAVDHFAALGPDEIQPELREIVSQVFGT